MARFGKGILTSCLRRCRVAGALGLGLSVVPSLVGQLSPATSAHFRGATTALGSSLGAVFYTTVDAAGNVYVLTLSHVIDVFPYSNGGYGPMVSISLPDAHALSGIAVDSAQNIFVTDSNLNTVTEIPYSSGAYGAPKQVLTGLASPIGIALDSAGDIYVSEYNTGAIRSFPYANGAYGTPKTIATGFSYPQGMFINPDGSLYVADARAFAVYKLTLNSGSYTRSTVATTNGNGPRTVALDGAGNLYYDASPNVVELPRNGASFGSAVNWGPYLGFGPGGVSVDAFGTMYVSDQFSGKVQIIQKAANFGTQAVGTTSAASATLNFLVDSGGNVGAPKVLVQGASGQDFTDSGNGTCIARNGYGTNTPCTVIVNFKPTAPGLRSGAVELVSSTGAVLATAYVYGTGTGPQLTFPSGQTSAVVSTGLNSPHGVAVDGNGNLFIADTSNNAIKEFPYTGGTYGAAVSLGSGYSNPYDVAVDGAGNLFVADASNGAVKMIPLSGGSYGAATVIRNGFGIIYGLAVDAAGNIFVADAQNGVVDEIPFLGASYGPTVVLASGLSNVDGVAVDPFGNVFFSDYSAGLTEIPYRNGSYGSVTAIDNPGNLGSVAADGSGNLYVSLLRGGSVRKYPYSGSYGSPVSLGTGISSPAGMAVDKAGNVYVADELGNAVRKIDLVDPPALSFGNTGVGATSTAQGVTLANSGNAALNFTIPRTGNNPSLSSNFSLSTSNAGRCPLVSSTSAAAGTLAAGSSCTDNISFAPAMSGNIAGSLIFKDDASSATQSVLLSGTAVAGTATVSVQNMGVVSGSTATLTAVISGGGVVPSGAVSFSVNGTTGIASTCMTSASSETCTATYSVAGLAAGGYTVAANYVGDANYNSATGSGTLSVVALSTTAPQTNIGSVSATQTATLLITTPGTLGTISVVTQGAVNLEYRLVTGGSCAVNTSYTQGQTCTVKYTFAPKAPGMRLGGIVLKSSDATPVVLGSVLLNGIGSGPLAQFQSPKSQTLVYSSLSTGRGLTVDASGNVFVSNSYSGSVVEFAAGTSTPTATWSAYAPTGVAIDGAGNLFFGSGNGIYEVPGASKTATPVLINGTITTSDNNLSVDGDGNLYTSDSGNGTIFKLPAGNYANASVLIAGGTTHRFIGMALDATGNLFAGDYITGKLFEVVAGSHTLTPVYTNVLLQNVHSLALDAAGDVYIASNIYANVYRVQAGTGAWVELPAPGQQSLAVAPDGSLYAVSGDTNLYHFLRTGQTVDLGSVTVGSTATAGVTLENDGNASLSISAVGTGTASFTAVATPSTPLTAGAATSINVTFGPQAGGTLSDTVTVRSNSLNVSNSPVYISVSGKGKPVPTITVGNVAASTDSTATLSASITGSLGAPAGAIAFTVNGSPVTGVTCTTNASTETCTASYSTTGVAAGNYTIIASYADDGTYAAGQATATLGVAPAGYTAPSTNLGATSAVQTAFILIRNAGTLGSVRVSTQGATNQDFREKTADAGTCVSLIGQAVSAGTTCSVQYTFTPLSPGPRYGGITLLSSANSSAVSLGSTYLQGTGNGPQVTFPATPKVTTLFSGIGYACGVATDAANNLYVLDCTAQTLVKYPFSGGAYGAAVQIGQAIDQPLAMAVDGNGNVFIVSGGVYDRLIMYPYNGTTYGPRVSVGSGLNYPSALAIDGHNNLFVENYNDNDLMEIPYVNGTYGPAVLIQNGLKQPRGIAVDGKGDLFVTNSGNNEVLELANNGNTFSAPVRVASGFSIPYGLTVDGGGNLYVADTYHQAIEKIPFNGSSYGSSVLLGQTFVYPTSVAVDGAGNVYGTTNDGTIVKIDLSDAPTFAFAATVVGQASADSPHSTLVANTGNQPLTFSSVATSGYSAFGVDHASSCSVSTPVPMAGTCVASADFTPNTSGPASGSLVLADGALPASQSIPLVGTGVVLSTSPVGTSVAASSSVSFTTSGVLGSISVVTQGATGLDFQPASGGTCVIGRSYTANASCTVNYTFNPRAPGQRLGAIVLKSSATPAATLSTTLIAGLGVGPQGLFPGGILANTFSTTLSAAHGLSVDASGNVFVSNSAAGTVLKFAPGATVSTTLASGYGTLAGTAVDGAGNVFFASSTGVYEVPGGQGTPISINAALTSADNNLSVDGTGNLFTSDRSTGAIYELPAGNYGNALTLISGGSGYRFEGMALDASGNLFAVDFNSGGLFELARGATSLAGLAGTSFSGANALAVDAAGDIYVDYSGGLLVYRYGSYNQPSLELSGAQQSVALGSDGSIYSVAGSTLAQYSRISGRGKSTSVAVGSATSTTADTLDNDGNAVLSIGSLAISGTAFSLDTLSPSSGSSETSIAPGGSLQVRAVYRPKTAGTSTGTLTITDNSLNVSGTTQTSPLKGRATAGYATVAATDVTADVHTSATLQATVSGYGAAPSGPVTVSVNGGASTVMTCVVGTSSEVCNSPFSISGLAPGSYAIAVNYNADGSDANYNAASGTATLTVNSALVARTSVASTSLTSGTAATAFMPVSGSGGTGSLAYSVSPALPSGLSFSAAGSLSGTPTVVSAATMYTVTVTDQTGNTASNQFSLVVNTGVVATQAIASKVLTANQPSVSFAPVTGTGGSGSLTYSVSPALPTGLGLSTTTGAVSGSPANAQAATTYAITVSDVNGATASATFSLTVNSAVTAAVSVATATLTADQTVTPFMPVTASGGTGALTYAISPALPNGLTFSTATGSISGTPSTNSASASYTVSATDSNGASASAGFSLAVSTEAPQITFTVADRVYSATPFAVGATSNSPGTLSYSVASGPATMSGDLVTLTGSGTVVLTASQAASGKFAAGSQNTSFAVTAATPTITFTVVGAHTFGDAAFGVSATSNSAGAITYSVVSGPASISGNTVTITGAGSVVLQANQAASGGYAAGSQNASFTVAPATPTLAFAAISTRLTSDAPFPVMASSASNGAVTYTVVSGPATVSGNTVTLSGSAGTVTLQATQAAAGNYAAASTQTSFVVNAPSAPTITFTVPDHTFGDPAFTVHASSNSSGAFTYSVVSGPATISGDTVTLTGAGTVVLQASQVAAGTYASGNSIVSFVVAGATPSISFTVADHVYGDAPFSLSANSNSAGAFTYTVISGPATLSGSTVTITGTGVVTLQAKQAANGNYAAATMTASFTVAPGAPVIVFSVANHTYGDAPFAVSATSNSAGAFTYSIVSGTATLSGNMVTLTGAGSVTLEVTQAANGNYAQATQTATFNAAAATPVISFSIPNHSYGDAAFPVAATSNSSGAFTYSVASGPATINGSVVTLTGAGTVTITASQAAAGNYASGTQSASFPVASGAPTLLFSVPGHTYGDAPFSVAATSNSSGLITYSVVSGPATISGQTVTLTGAGNVVLQASQAASGNYAAASQTASFPVATAAPVLVFSVANHTYGDAPFAVSATSNSLGAITYSVASGPATISGSTVTLTGAGSVVLTASQVANGNYSAGSQSASFNVAAQAPTLTFAPISTHLTTDAPFTVSASSASAGAVTYSVVNGPASISGNTVSLSGTAGTVTLSASQAATGNYAAATVQTSFVVNSPSAAVITFAVPNHTFGDPAFTVAATSNSPGAITYSVVSGPATISGATVTLTGAGSVTLQASQLAAGTYAAGSAVATFTVAGQTPTIAFSVSNHTFGDAPFSVNASSNSTGAIAYTVLSGPATISGNTLTLTGAGTVVLQASQSASGNFVAGIQTASFGVAAGGASITFNVSNHTFGDAAFPVNATSNSAGAFTYSVLSGPATVSGNLVTLTGAGAVTLQASQAASGSYAQGAQTTTFTVAPASPTISFSVPNHTFGDAPFTVSASSNSSGAFTYTVASGPASVSGNTVTLTGSGSVTLTALQAAAGNYAAGTQTATFTVASGAPALVFTVPNHTFGDAPFAVAATSPSSGAISYSVLSGPATISGSTVTLTGAGSVVLQASQAASGSYAAATQTASFTVAAAAPTITFSVANHTYGDLAFAVTATSNSSGALTYSVLSGPATITGNTVTLTGAGAVTLTVTQAAIGNYSSGTQNSTFTVAAQTPSLSFTPIASHLSTDPPFVVSATSASPGAITYSVVSGPATLSGNTVTLTGGTGAVTLAASQAATTNYAATTAQTSFVVNSPSAPTISFAVLNHTFGDAPFTVNATSNSPGAITYIVLSGPATISGNTVTLTGAGTVTLQASQAAAGNFAAGTAVASFTVAGHSPTIVFTVPNHTFGDAAFAVSATSDSTGTLTYTVLSGPATIVGNTVTLTGSGTVVLQANQAAAGNYIAGTQTASFTVAAGGPSIAFSVGNHTFGDAPFVVAATSNSSGAFTYTVVSGPATISGSTVTLTGAGSVTLQAAQAAAGNYAPGTQTASFTVSVAAPAISFTVPNHTFGDNPFSVNATSNSSGAITYAIVSGPATVNGNIVTLTGSGSVTITATQAASGNFAAGTQTATFSVTTGTPTISFSVPNHTYGDAPFAVNATSNSTGAFTYSVTSGPASVSGNVVTLTGSGNVTLTATQAAAGNYASGTQNATFSVASGAPSITLSIPNHVFGDAPFAVGATSNSSGAIVYSVVSGPATISGSIVTLTGAGTVVVQASQSASGGYSAGTQTATFTVSTATPSLVFRVSDHTYGDAPFAVLASSNSAGAITYSVVSGPATISGNVVTITGAGTVTLSASQVANGNYSAATQTASFTIAVQTPSLVFSPIPSHLSTDAPFVVAASSASSGNITYAVVSGPATISGNTLTLSGATGTVTITATQAAAGNYGVASTQTSFAVNSPSAPTITFSIANHTFGDAAFRVAASSNSQGAFTYTVVSGPATVSGDTVTLTGAGSVTIQASQAANGTFATGTAIATFTVAGRTPAIVFALGNQTYGDAPFVVSATSNSTGAFSYSVVSGPAAISGSTVTLAGTGTVVLQATQAAAGNYAAGTQTASFTVSAAAPAIVFNVGNHVYGDAAFAVEATSNSTGAFSYIVVSGPASILGNTLTLTGTGAVVLRADQAAAGNYLAGSANATFTVTAANAPPITFAVASHTYGDAPFAVNASSISTGAFSYAVLNGPATISGNIVTLTGAGNVTLQARQAADANYAAGSQTASFSVAAAVPAISFNLTNHTFGDADFAAVASSNSAGAFVYTITSGNASIINGLIHITGTGVVKVHAAQAAAGNYAAGSADASFSVAPAIPALKITAIASHLSTDSPFTVQATSPSSGAITFAVVSGPATVSGSTVSLTGGVGAVTLRASQAAQDPYDVASATTTFAVNAPDAPTIQFAIGNHTFGDADFTVNATSSSPGAITYSVLSGNATVNGSTVHLTGIGSVVVRAAQAASGSYAASSATATFTVAGATPAIVFNVADHAFGTADFAVNATSNSSGAFSYAVKSGPATLSGNIIHLTGVGSVTLTATEAAAGNYAQGSRDASFVATSGSAVITFSVGNHTFGDAPFLVNASSSSTGAFTYSVVSGPATLNGNLVTLTAAGTVILKATQAADANFTGSSQTTTFTVAPGASAIVFTVPNHAFGDAPFTVNASSSSTGAFTYSVVSGPATLNGNLVTLTAAGTVVLKATQAADANFTGSSQTTTFTVTPGASAIVFTVPNHVFGDAPFSVNATSASTGAFTYSVMSGPAMISGKTVTLTGAGTVVLRASQAADANYAAGSQSATFTVAVGSAPITFAVPNHTFGDAPFVISATSSSTGAFTYAVVSGPATVSGNTVTLTGAGSVTLRASQSSAGSYGAGTQTASFTVAVAVPTITFVVSNHVFGDPSFTVAANSNSTGALSYRVVSGPATMSGNTVTLTGAGPVVLEADQAAAGNYASGTQQATFTVAPGTATLGFSIANHVYGDAPFAVNATSLSKGAITYSVVSGPVSLAGNLVTLHGVGSVTLAASQAADGAYTASSQQASFTVAPATLTLTANNTSRVYGAANPVLSGTITGAAYGDTFAETFTTTAVSSSAPGNYNIVPSVTGANLADYSVSATNGTLTITQAPATLTLTASTPAVNPNQSVTFAAMVASTTTGIPSGTVSFYDNGALLQTVGLVSGNATYTTTLSAGTGHAITASYSGDQDFLPVTTASNLLITVAALDFTLTPSSLLSPMHVALGQAVNFTFSVTPLYGSFPGDVTYSITGLPKGATYSFSPSSLPASSGGAAIVGTIKMPIDISTNLQRNGSDLPFTAGVLLLPFFGLARKRKWSGALMALAVLGAASFMTGCGSASSVKEIVPAKGHTYNVNLNVTSGTITHSTPITLIVE